MPHRFPHYHIGHLLNEPAHLREFALVRFEQMTEPDIEDPHYHAFYEILWVEDGHSRQVIDGQAYALTPGCLFFISPGQLHLFEDWHELRGGTLLFTEHFFLLDRSNRDQLFELSFLDNRYSQPLIRPEPADFQEMLHTIRLLEAEAARLNKSDAILQAYVHVLLHQIQRSIDSKGRLHKPALVLFKCFRQLLEDHHQEPFTAGDYAARLHITPHHLNRVCRQVAGRTATQVIRGRVMLEAQRRLAYTDAAVGEIATELGFQDDSYFARAFAKETGMTPSAYRQSMSEKYRKGQV